MKMTMTIALAALAATSLSASSAEYKHKIEAKGVTFEWAVDGQNLNVRLAAKTTGWVGIGFNNTKDMQDATFVIGAVKDGVAKAALFVGTSPSAHSKEVDQDFVTNVAGKEENGSTELSFTIPLAYAKNPKVKPIALDKDVPILLAYAIDDSIKTKHRDRAELKVNLTTGVHK